jgi:Ca2+-binding EF-hand superfamily protein
MPECRVALVQEVFAALCRSNAGVITIHDIRVAYDASHAECVRCGEKTEVEALEEFLATWDRNRDAVITEAEFIEYYAVSLARTSTLALLTRTPQDISASIDEDSYFELMLRNSWHLSGGEGPAFNTSNRRVRKDARSDMHD